MKKYFNNVVSLLLIAITMSSLSACASKTAASQTAPDKQTSSVTTPQAEMPVPDIDLRDYTQKPNLEKLFEGYTENYAYAFREARFTDNGFSGDSYSLPLRQVMTLNGGDVQIWFTDESWEILQNTTVDVNVDIVIVVQSTKSYLQKKAGAAVTNQTENSLFSIVTDRSEDNLEIPAKWYIFLGRK